MKLISGLFCRRSLAAGKIAILPQFDAATQNYVARRVQNLRDEIVAGQFRVREPKPDCEKIPLNKIDLVLVPGVAFDLRGNRLGRGRGFYDRLLAEIRGVKCGVAFDEQVVDEVPAGNIRRGGGFHPDAVTLRKERGMKIIRAGNSSRPRHRFASLAECSTDEQTYCRDRWFHSR